jgi:ABC-2 type transport system ATP-binding protein
MLQLEHLSKRYEKVPALEDLSFELKAGDVAGLLGPNGAGKSTCMKCIAGLLRPDSGTIRIAGHAYRSMEARKALSYIPETPEPYPLLTSWEHLQFVAQAYGLKNWQTKGERLMERFEMGPLRDKLGKEMSKGMRQKISLICGLLPEPSLLLIDEPMIGLDPKAIRETKELFKELKNEGKTLLISTHLIDSVEHIADRALILQKGRLIIDQPLEKLRLEYGQGDQSLEDIFFNLTGNEGV